MIKLLSKYNLSFFIFLLINFLFGIKYLSRITKYYIPISLIIVIVYFVFFKSKKYLLKYQSHLQILNYFLILSYILFFMFIFNKISQQSLNVDRWSVISSFWDNYFSNNYVYFAKSHMGNPPGPMPLYFILALPFYLIGELGYFSLLGIVIFYILLRSTKTNIVEQSNSILLILCSLFYLWEVTCRSNLFLNSTLILFVLVYYFKNKNLLFSAILIGLSLSTRNVLVIPFIISFIYELKNKSINIKQLTIMGVISLLTFGLTFLPFVFNHLEDFKLVNPFIIQSSALMPFELTLIFIGLAFGFGLLCKNELDIYFYSGLLLFLTIVGYYIYHFSISGFYNSFFNSVADISYFILCLPFAIFYISQTEKE